jgi:hypothetical protein
MSFAKTLASSRNTERGDCPATSRIAATQDSALEEDLPESGYPTNRDIGRKVFHGQIRETPCEIFRPRNSRFTNLAVRAAVLNRDCDRHKFALFGKLGANRDVPFAAIVRDAELSDLHMGNFQNRNSP